jgi:hypothetical protein
LLAVKSTFLEKRLLLAIFNGFATAPFVIKTKKTVDNVNGI